MSEGFFLFIDFGGAATDTETEHNGVCFSFQLHNDRHIER